MQFLIGVDVGTSGCKAMAIHRDGVVIASSEQLYPTRYPRPGWAEQDPESWYWAACQAIRRCLAAGQLNPSEAIGLSVDGPAHNVALMGEGGETLYPTIHWSDLRSVEQAARLEQRWGERIARITYQRVNPSWTLTQLVWLKEQEPEVWSQLRRILVTKDYVRYRFTGQYQTDAYDAIGTQLYDVNSARWSDELCELLDFPPAWLPLVSPARAIAGGLWSDAARDTGLPSGLPVAIGSGDSVVEAFGVGAVEPGHGIVKLGTAVNVNLVTAHACPSSTSLTYRHVIDGRWFSITATNSGTSTLRWFRDTFVRPELLQTRTQSGDGYELIDQLAADVPAGCAGLLFHPYLMGERTPYWDPHLRGDFVGIGAHHQANHFARAILEGVAFSVRDCLQAVEALGQPITEMRLLGGGARSPLWRQIICDVLGQPLVRPVVEGAAYGAALLAGVAVGVFSDWQAAIANGAQVNEVLQPNAEAHELYNGYFEVYQEVTRDLVHHNHRLAALAQRTR